MNHYSIKLHTLPCPGHISPLTRAIVYHGTTPIAATAAYERNGGTGVAAAMKDARALIDGRIVADWFTCYMPDDFAKVSSTSAVITTDGTEIKESESPMVKDYISTYVTMIVIAGAVCAFLMKGCM